MERNGLPAYIVLCLVGSAAIFLFLEALRRVFGGPWSSYRVTLALIVCAGFCFRAAMERRRWRADRETDLQPTRLGFDEDHTVEHRPDRRGSVKRSHRAEGRNWVD